MTQLDRAVCSPWRKEFVARDLKRHIDTAAVRGLTAEDSIKEEGGGCTFFWKGKPGLMTRIVELA